MNIILPVLGGLGLFLYGMNLMGVGLENAAGEKLKKLIEILTNNRLMGVIVGALVTMVIQSSSATTVMVIGFVNAGLMTLYQAVGVIMGANLGTTVTAQLIAFNLTDYAPLAVAIGVGIWLTTNKKRSKNLAEILIGFGILFIGMDMMSGGLAPLADNPVFRDIIINLENPVLGIIVGLGLTTILQSSSASIGLLQALASQGLITTAIAFPILFGDNIGTTTTALISSVGANKTAKRAAVIHFLFNLIGTILFMTVLRKPVEYLVVQLTPNDLQRQLANAHTFFNLINVAIQFPFANFLVKAAIKLVPGDEETEELDGIKYLDERIIETPTIALGQVQKETIRMSKYVRKNLENVSKAFKAGDEKKVNEIFEKERIINRIEKDSLEYLIKLSNAPLTEYQNEEVKRIMNIINDLERIADHVDNIGELSQVKIEEDLTFTSDAIEEFDNIYNKTLDGYNHAVDAFINNDRDSAMEVIKIEEQVDALEKTYRSNHINRLNKLQCQVGSGVIFLDIISSLERISDYSSNIAMDVLDMYK